MKFKNIVPPNESPKIEHMTIYKDTMFIGTSQSIFAVNLNTNKIEEVEFEK